MSEFQFGHKSENLLHRKNSPFFSSIILLREILSKNICFLRESNLTTSASKSGAGLPNLGNEFDKI